MIRRFIRWNKNGAIGGSQEGPSALVEASLSAHAERLNSGTPETKQLLFPQFLAENQVDAQAVLRTEESAPSLRINSELTIAELELSVRSFNCLEAASIKTLGDLLSWSPARLMRLQNFGRKCMQEISELVRALGFPIPSNEEAPIGAVESFPLKEDSAPRHLAEHPVGADVVLTVKDSIPTLCLCSELTIAELELSVRSFNCLEAASIKTLGDLLNCSPAQLKKLHSFGRKSMQEISDIVQKLGFPMSRNEDAPIGAVKSSPLQGGSAPLACLLELKELASEGPVLERMHAHGWQILADLTMHSVDGLVQLANLSVQEKLEFERLLNALSLTLPIELPTWFLENPDELRAGFRAELQHLSTWMSAEGARLNSWGGPWPSQSLNKDILDLIPKGFDSRRRQIVLDLLGLAGKNPLTLDEVAKAQTPPLVRERVRQIAKPTTDALSQRGRKLPALLMAIASLKRLAPCSLEQVEAALFDNRILDAPMPVATILELTRRAGLEQNLVIKGHALLDSDTCELIDALLQTAAKLSSRWGVADWREIELQYPNVCLLPVKELLHGVAWLDSHERYFVFPTRENSLANRLARILAVTPRLKIGEAYSGAFRDSRVDAGRLPEELFAPFCRLWSWCSVDGDEVVSGTGLPPSQVSGDDLLVLLLREIGHPVRRRELVERAASQGLQQELVTYALSYSNVIASANGYFAVIGDPRLEQFANNLLSAPPEVLKPSEEPDNTGLVPDGSSDDFAGQLISAVENRVTKLGLMAPWSVSELRLSDRDRDRLIAWGRIAKWDFRNDSGSYQTQGGEKIPKRSALGLAFLLFASEAVRRFGDSGTLWPAIDQALDDHQQNLFMVRTGVPKTKLREAVEAACRTFGLRHGFEDVGQQVWVRTVGLQSGLLCSQLPELGAMLAEPFQMQPLVIQLLLDIEGPNFSASFLSSWKLLQDYRSGVLSGSAALQAFASDAWLSPFPADQLVEKCTSVPSVRTRVNEGNVDPATHEVYRYFSAPVLRWAVEDAYLEYTLNEFAPPWRESAALILICDDPFRKERIVIENDRWLLSGGPIRLPLTQRTEASFRFKFVQGKEEVFADWKDAGLPRETPFTFFRASGAWVSSADDVPRNEELVLFHKADLRLVGVDTALVFRSVLRGACRLTRLPAGAVTKIQLIDRDQAVIWSLPIPEEITSGAAEPMLSIRDGKWGTEVEVTLPNLTFPPERLRLNNGEVLLITRDRRGTYLRSSPGLGRAQAGRLFGSAGGLVRSTYIKLSHRSADFGAAVETDGSWQPLDGSSTLDASTLRTRRLMAKVRGPLDTNSDVSWMEGSRTISGLRRFGTLLAGFHGLGEGLGVVRGTYNNSQIEVVAARAVTDGGFWRSVQLEADDKWRVHLPFEEPLEEEHELWVWTEDSLTPRRLPRDSMVKEGFVLRWNFPTAVPVLGWAFSFSGARIGSVINPEILSELIQHHAGTPWGDTAMWLRWWHAPVLHADMRTVVGDRVRNHPVETLKAWLLSDNSKVGLVFDELRGEAWAGAARELLWEWRPGPGESVEILSAMDILTGNIDHDIQKPPSREAVDQLARMSPILLTDALRKAVPHVYPYPKPQLAVLLGMVLQAINPNAAENGFRLEALCERYAKAESRLDGRFIYTSLIGSARAVLDGERQGSHNLRVAFHQVGLRELISIALIRDVFERWQTGTED